MKLKPRIARLSTGLFRVTVHGFVGCGTSLNEAFGTARALWRTANEKAWAWDDPDTYGPS